jgi:hypothetical protein
VDEVEAGVQVIAGEDVVHWIVTEPVVPKAVPVDVRIRFSVTDEPGATLKTGVSAFNAKSPIFAVTVKGKLADER